MTEARPTPAFAQPTDHSERQLENVTGQADGDAQAERPCTNATADELRRQLAAVQAELDAVEQALDNLPTNPGTSKLRGKQHNIRVNAAIHTAADTFARRDHLRFRVTALQTRIAAAERRPVPPELLTGAARVKDKYGWYDVVRVNKKSVTVEGVVPWPTRIPHEKIFEVQYRDGRRATAADGNEPPADIMLTAARGGRAVIVLPDDQARSVAAASRCSWREFPGQAYGESAVIPADSPEGALFADILATVAERGSTVAGGGPSDRTQAKRGHFYGSITGTSGWNELERWWALDVSTPEHRALTTMGSLHRLPSGDYQFSG